MKSSMSYKYSIGGRIRLKVASRIRSTDPDETEGRKLYRDRADALARAQMYIAKRVVRLDLKGDKANGKASDKGSAAPNTDHA